MNCPSKVQPLGWGRRSFSVVCRPSGASILACVGFLLLAACAVGPNYKRPVIQPPDQFRGATSNDPASIAGTKWFDLFHDDQLKGLVSTALEQNFDLAIATERIEEARAQFRVTRANQYPNLTEEGTFTAVRQSSVGSFKFLAPGTDLSASYTQQLPTVSWDLDLWGRLRRLSESARAQYFATEEGRRAVIVSLVGDVTTNYFILRERDRELQIANQTRDIAQDSLRLVELRHGAGAATGLDVHQAEQFLYTATAQIASANRDIEQTENALCLLLGRAPGDIPRGKTLEEFTVPADPPPGLPSALLERRPDIREAEQNLIAANAQIGAARALYFPDISLTGFLGAQSRALTSLFTAPARYWTLAPNAVLPIFNAGQVRAGVRLTEARKRELVIAYQKAIYTSFREVSDALVGYRRTREQLAQQDNLVRALSESTRLSRLRYEGGLDSYLQVLDSERNLFQGQLTLAELRLGMLNSFVELYRALGGGWQ
jgi:NodT family efflux transporter outer membrane factor (OMF) lipoprotein